MENPSIAFWLSRRATLTPSKVALVYEEKSWTYAEFDRLAERFALGLRSLGVGVGDRVGYLDYNHPNFLVTMFAAARLGAIFVPLNFRLTAPELSYIINDSGIHTLVSDASFGALVEEMQPELAGVNHVRTIAEPDGGHEVPAGMVDYADLIAAQQGTQDLQEVSPEDTAFIMYTSGTTGHPKGAMLTHGNLLWSNLQTWIAFDTSPHDVTLASAPLFHIGGLNVLTINAFIKGATVVLARHFDPQAALDLIEKHRVTTMFGVPAMFQFMSMLPTFADADLSSLTDFFCGGAPVPEPLIKLYAARGHRFVQGYGLTETAPFVSIVPVESVDQKVGSAGLPMFYTEVVLADEQGRAITEPGVPGEVLVKGPQVMAGYWNQPEATAAAIQDGWLHTGDVATFDDDGFLYIVDRKKDMIISGGENIYPAELEAVLYAHPDIAEVAVIGVPSERWGESPHAVVVARDGAALTEGAVLEHCRGRLAPYKHPRSVSLVEALPRSGSGKVLKYALREVHGSPVEVGTAH